MSTPASMLTDAVAKKNIKHLQDMLTDLGRTDLVARSKKMSNARTRLRFLYRSLDSTRNSLKEAQKYKNNTPPIGVREFLTSKKYMDKSKVLWPKVIDEIEEACSGKYIEGVFTGGIGCAKSTAALYIQSYFLYILSRLKNPHREFGLDPDSEIMIIFQSLNATVSKQVEYERFKSMIEGSPYFEKHFRFNKDKTSQMEFPNRIIVKSVSGSESAAIGQNVISAIIDEVNFMQVVQKSSKSADGGVYNQAIELYNSIVRRRESRFMEAGGNLPGLLCLVSSARYPGQFTDKRKEAANREIRAKGRTSIFIYDKRQWEVAPEVDENGKRRYCGETFRLFTGDLTRKPRFIEDGEPLTQSDLELTIEIPIEHKHAFEDDMYDAIRDVAGLATLATHPFIPYPEKVGICFAEKESIFSTDVIDFVQKKTLIYPKRFVNRHLPRYVHCDLALTGDSAGFAVGYVAGFTQIKRADGAVEILPMVEIDGLMEIRPPKGGEIDLGRVRGLIYKLTELGLPIKWVSYDSFASADSIQIMKQKGYVSGLVSMDVTPVPYEILKQAIIDERLSAPEHYKCMHELGTLERDPQTGKIDHPEVSSKDVSDALAGVVYGLTMRRENWVTHKINPHSIPNSITSVASNHKNSVAGGVGAN